MQVPITVECTTCPVSPSSRLNFLSLPYTKHLQNIRKLVENYFTSNLNIYCDTIHFINMGKIRQCGLTPTSEIMIVKVN